MYAVADRAQSGIVTNERGADVQRRLDALNLSELERRTIRAALQKANGNKVHAAKALGISRRALYRLITKYGLEEHQAEGGAARR